MAEKSQNGQTHYFVTTSNVFIFGHVVTGDDLFIINNKLLKELHSKGPNFREPKPLDFQTCLSAIRSGVEKCAEDMAAAMKVDPDAFLPWANMIFLKVNSTILSVTPKIRNSSPQMCSETECCQKLFIGPTH